MRYYKIIENGYILAIGTGLDGVEISKEEYDTIMTVITNPPGKVYGYTPMLREDLTWEMVECDEPDVNEEEISDEEALNIILGVSE